MRARRPWIVIVALVLALSGHAASGQESSPSRPSADEVLDAVKRVLAWAQQARVTALAVREAAVGLVVREEDQAVARVLHQAFEAARARAALVVQTSAASDDARARSTRRAERRATLEAAIREGEREVERAQARARTAPRARREARAREAAAAAHRLALDRMRLELLDSLQQTDTALASGQADLVQQVQALQETRPEAAPEGAKPASAPAGASATPSLGTWGSVHRLLALQRARNSLGQLAIATEELARGTDVDVQRTRESVRELSRTLRATTGAPASTATGPAPAGAASLGEQDFRRELERLKLLGATMPPLRAQAALLRRFESDLRLWQRGIDRDVRTELQNLGVGLVGVVLALGGILAAGILWRIAVNRYVTDPYRRRLALNARRIVLAVAFVLVLVFHFTSELTALVTALGFAAAGIAFALQNVILAVAGYFSIVAPNGIRVGDRVSLQAPFGYVHGEVIEIGLVRIRLRELTADRLEPTGRIVVSPNSVVFTGSFFKHPPAQAAKAA